jgi:ATPase subunit of ABC transporter with duplicated ATPase domains
MQWRTGALSRGSRLKVALARSIVHEPAVMLLDEPSAHLDDEAASWLAGFLRDRAQSGASVLVATHDRFLVERAGDEVAVLREGRIVSRDTVMR